MKKRRKERDDDEEDVVIENHSKISRKKGRKKGTEDGVDGKKKKKSTKVREEFDPSKSISSKGVHLDSLQSIFANKDEADGAFTLFGGDPLSEPSSPNEVIPSSTPPRTIQTIQQTHREPLYFFPHYDSPQKNAQSLFPVSSEPFYHNRTECEAPSSRSNC